MWLLSFHRSLTSILIFAEQMCRVRINVLVTPAAAARERVVQARLLLRAISFLVRNADAHLELFLRPDRDLELLAYRPVSVFVTRNNVTEHEFLTTDRAESFSNLLLTVSTF